MENNVDANDKNEETLESKRLLQKTARQEKIKKQKRFLIGAFASAAAVIAIIIIALVFLNSGNSEATKEDIILTETSVSDVVHLSFDMLSVTDSSSSMSVEEFEKALELLYKKGYVLVDVYEIANEDEEGNFSGKNTITFPENKTPLIISLTDASFPFDSSALGFADKLVIKDESLTARYTRESGVTVSGNYDLITVLESFIKKNEDFSFNGARAVIGLSGSCGILGYRTTSYLGLEENNPYAEYGTFDTLSEKTDALQIVDKLKELGYHFASCGFEKGISYGAQYSIVEEDAFNWENEVASITGTTDLLILPNGTDIASWKGYFAGNAKFELLSGLGFKYFFVNETTTPYLLQIQDSYVRQTVYEINSYDDFLLSIGEEPETEEKNEENTEADSENEI